GALVLLSDVDGLYDGDPRRGGARLVAEVRDPADLAEVTGGGAGGAGRGTGGMASKLEAARVAAGAGVPVLLAAADQAGRALTSADVGTFFAPQTRRTASRLFWLRHATQPRGRLVLDDGAGEAGGARRQAPPAPGGTGGAGAVRGGR